MAKRSRIGGRPTGRQRPGRAPGTRPSTQPRSGTATSPTALTEAEAARAAELEAALLAEEQAAATARAAAQAARSRRPGRDLGPAQYDQPLRIRAAQEYAYVARDIRRIGITAGLMLAILVAAAILINVLNVGRA
jgi:hypothetical protein